MKTTWKRAETWPAFFEANPKIMQGDLAAALGITQSAVSQIVNGKRMPRPDLALRIQELTGISVVELTRARAGSEAMSA